MLPFEFRGDLLGSVAAWGTWPSRESVRLKVCEPRYDFKAHNSNSWRQNRSEQTTYRPDLDDSSIYLEQTDI